MKGKLRVLAILAQGTSSWVGAVANLSAAFTGLIACGLALVSIVIGELRFAFGEGGSKSALAGIIVPAVVFTLPGGIHQTRATPEAWKWNHVPLPEP